MHISLISSLYMRSINLFSCNTQSRNTKTYSSLSSLLYLSVMKSFMVSDYQNLLSVRSWFSLRCLLVILPPLTLLLLRSCQTISFTSLFRFLISWIKGIFLPGSHRWNRSSSVLVSHTTSMVQLKHRRRTLKSNPIHVSSRGFDQPSPELSYCKTNRKDKLDCHCQTNISCMPF